MRVKSLLIFLGFSGSFSQEIPIEFYKYKEKQILYDMGENWDDISIFNDVRYFDIYNEKINNHFNLDTLYINTRFGVLKVNNHNCVYAFGHFRYKKYLYGYLYPRIVNNPNYFNRYSGISRDISRFGFSSGETDISGIGFQNNWLSFQLGRGRESWGAGNDIKIILSEESPSYDYGMISSKYRNIGVKYFHGFLESNASNINRVLPKTCDAVSANSSISKHLIKGSTLYPPSIVPRISTASIFEM